MECQAKALYERTRGKVAFNMPKDARRVGGNQYGTRYTFPDGSVVRIGGAHAIIEWRSHPKGPGAIRALWSALCAEESL